MSRPTRTISSIIDEVCLNRRVGRRELKTCSSHRVAHIRQEVMYLAYDAGHSLKQIARPLRRKDHTTVHFGVCRHAARNGLSTVRGKPISSARTKVTIIYPQALSTDPQLSCGYVPIPPMTWAPNSPTMGKS